MKVIIYRGRGLCLFLPIILSCLFPFTVNAQEVKPGLELDAQIRTRTELRLGQGNLPVRNAKPAFFTSQRSRLNAGFSADRYQIFVAIQDVRVWGQDVSQINRVSPAILDGVIFHQAWGEILLADSLSFLKGLRLRAGRQELVYDDHRLLGNLDWLQQGRRHDAALIKTETDFFNLDLGLAFNQNRELNSGTLYVGTPSPAYSFPSVYPVSTNGLQNMYKSMQFAHVSRKFEKSYGSFLFLKDDFQKFRDDSVRTFMDGTWSRFTTGLYSVIKIKNESSVTGSLYYQGGRNPYGQNVSAWLASVYSDFKIKGFGSIGPGIDYTSGNNMPNQSSVNRAFDPLYGTPHKFWGNLDYFYVASPSLSTGLLDAYFRINFVKNKYSVSMNVHEFYIPVDLEISGNSMNKRLGTEVDLDFTYNLSRFVSFTGGYAIIFGTNTLRYVKMSPNAERTGQFAYLMINIKTK